MIKLDYPYYHSSNPTTRLPLLFNNHIKGHCSQSNSFVVVYSGSLILTQLFWIIILLLSPFSLYLLYIYYLTDCLF